MQILRSRQGFKRAAWVWDRSREIALLEPLEPRRLMAGWVLEPAWDVPAGAEPYFFYDLTEAGPRWRAEYQVQTENGITTQVAVGDRFHNYYDETLPDRPGTDGPDFESHLQNVEENYEREYEQSFQKKIDFEPVLYGEGVYSFTGTLIESEPVVLPNETPIASIPVYEDATLLQPGDSRNSLFTVQVARFPFADPQGENDTDTDLETMDELGIV